MPKFSERSLSNLSTCHEDLREVFYAVIKHFDCTIICGHRTQEDQDRVYHEGRSQVQWPNSMHNTDPSIALDAAPWPIDWKDRERFIYFGGFVKGVAAKLGIALRWGGDWDSDFEVHDNKFDDLAHFELIVDLER